MSKALRPFCLDAKTRLRRPGGLEPPYIYLLHLDKLQYIQHLKYHFLNVYNLVNCFYFIFQTFLLVIIYQLEPRQRRPTQCFNKIMANLCLRGHVTLKGHVTPKSIFSKVVIFHVVNPQGSKICSVSLYLLWLPR